MRNTLLVLLVLILCSCESLDARQERNYRLAEADKAEEAAKEKSVKDRLKTIKIAKADPADNYTEIGPITASDGSGCGLFGSRGSYDGAIMAIKNAAYEQGGDYVQIVTLTEPHIRGGCMDNAYVISGTLFKKTSASPSPISISATPPKSGIEKLKELKSLLDGGVITQQEFDEQKHKILESGI